MSTNEPPQGPYGPSSWPPQNPQHNPSGPGGAPGWPPPPPQQPPAQSPPQQPAGWSEQPTTQWPAQRAGGGGWSGPTQPSAPQSPYAPTPAPPPAGGHYAPPPARPPGGSKATWWIIGGAIAVVVVLIAAIGVVLAVRAGGDPNPSPTGFGGHPVGKAKTKVLWTLPEPPGSDIVGANSLAGLWVSDDSVVRTTVAGLTAYNLDTGKQLWNRPAPAGASVCEASPKAVDGVGAIIFGATVTGGSKCDRLMAIDAKTGDPKWDVSLHKSSDPIRDFSDPFTSVSVIDGAIVAQTSDALRAYGLSNGSPRWGLIPKGGADSNCRPTNSLGDGDRVLLVLGCLGQSGSISAVDAATGHVTWAHPTTSTEGDPLFMNPISVRPAVIAAETLSSSSQMLILDDSTGATKKQISESAGGSSAMDFTPDGSRNSGATFYHVAIKDGTLYAATEGASGATRNEIVAIDLATGTPTWTKASAPDTRETLIKADDDGVLTLNQGTFESLPRLVRYDLKTGKATNGVTLPADIRDKIYTVTPLVQGNKILLVATRSSADTPPITVLGE